MNCIEDYTWNEKKQRIEVNFSMQSAAGAKPTILQQRAFVTNKDTNTKWSINPKIGRFVPYIPIVGKLIFFLQEFSCR